MARPRGAAARRPSTVAGRVVLVPLGAGLTVRDDLVSTFRGIAGRYGTRRGFEREIARYEKRGARIERNLRKRQRSFERTLDKILSSAQELISSG